MEAVYLKKNDCFIIEASNLILIKNFRTKLKFSYQEEDFFESTDN